MELAKRNKIQNFPYDSEASIKQRMGDARNLPSFIEIYEQLLSVMLHEEDFYDVAMHYFQRVHSQGVVYCEMFFDPQMHTTRGISFATVISALRRARIDAADKFNIKCSYILCVNKDRSVQSALEHLELALPHKDIIIGVGTDNPELVDFPSTFSPYYTQARQYGFHITAHCDVNFEGALINIRGCFHTIKTERIDHGINVLDDNELVEYAKEKQIGFTVCPTFFYTRDVNKLRVEYFEKCAKAAKKMLAEGLCVTLASDDPGIMCCRYVGEIYEEVRHFCELPWEAIVQLVKNGFKMAWIEVEERMKYLESVDKYCSEHHSAVENS